jgi:peptidoglycan hydrolase CwlO-like protein
MTADALSRLANAFREMQEEQALTLTQRAAAQSQIEVLLAEVDSITNRSDTARRRIQQLEQTNAELDKELKEKTAELERIKRVIRG